MTHAEVQRCRRPRSLQEILALPAVAEPLVVSPPRVMIMAGIVPDAACATRRSSSRGTRPIG
ncbi:MAG TPA: hypothetical protein VIU11_24770, partial [Nakamurella sp.]